MGHISQRQDHAFVGCHGGPDKGGPNPRNGVVQSRTSDSVEPHFPTFPSKPLNWVSSTFESSLAGVEESMVGLSHGHPNPLGREGFCLERTTISFTGANLERIESGGGAHRKKDVGGFLDSTEYVGQQEL